MLKDLLHAVVGLALVPVLLATKALHNWATGRSAILELEIKRAEDLLARQQTLQLLRYAGRSRRIEAILLRIQDAPGSWAACQDLRRAIRELQAAGKPVYAYVETPGNAVMWLASKCDRIFMAPTGEVGLVGVGVELTFFGQALQRLGVEPDFEAAGAYKSFGEPWTRSYASPHNQEAVTELVRDLHLQLIDDVAEGRSLEVEALLGLLDEAPLSPERAVETGLVDELAYTDQVKAWLEETHGKSARLVSWAGWANRESVVRWIERFGDSGKIVSVVHLEGSIVVDGPKNSGQIRARQVVPLLRGLRESEQVGAVVLHVNSPGGSALASDLIWREVDRLREEKPVVAVFEDVSASGGVYLAAPAHEILVRPATLTGSIGVFGGKLVLGDALRRLGVTTQSVSSAANANLYSPARRFSEPQRQRFRASLQRFYDGFVDRVARGRDRDPEQVEPYCRGRVWTGRKAQEHGLVDGFGNLDDGIERARVLAQLPLGRYRRHDLITWRRRGMLQKAVSSVIRGALGPGARLPLGLVGRILGKQAQAFLDVLETHEGQPLAMLPFDLRLR